MSVARSLATAQHEVEGLAWDEVAGRLRDGAAAVLPIGAAAKQHGLHLPMGTDRLQADWLAARLAGRAASRGIDVLIWPVLGYGYYPAFTRYPGSVGLGQETFRTTVRELVVGLAAAGARAVLVLDTGISTLQPVGDALAGIAGAVHLQIHAGPRYRDVAGRLATQRYGTHADELETSRLLAMASDVVDLARAEAPPAHSDYRRRGPLEPYDAGSPLFSPTGATGEPLLATREKGEMLLAAMLDDLEDAVMTAIPPVGNP